MTLKNGGSINLRDCSAHVIGAAGYWSAACNSPSLETAAGRKKMAEMEVARAILCLANFIDSNLREKMEQFLEQQNVTITEGEN